MPQAVLEGDDAILVVSAGAQRGTGTAYGGFRSHRATPNHPELDHFETNGFGVTPF